MKIISVIPLKKGILKGDLTYFTSLDVAVGNVVLVPLRGKKTLALVTSVESLENLKSDVKKMDFNLRKVTEDKGRSIFLKEYLEAVFDTSKYFVANINNTLSSLIPSIFLEKYDNLMRVENNQKIIFKNEQKIRIEKSLLQYTKEDRISTYKTLVRESFAQGKSVFLVLPTEFDIEDFTSQLSKGIEQFTFAVHSGKSEKKNLLACEKIIIASHPVLIIGTPPFLSIPRTDIGTIILEHESSNAYKTISRPHIDLRIFVEIFASKINAKLIIADQMLRFETIGRKDTDNLNPVHPLSYRIDFPGKIIVLNPKQDSENEEKSPKFKIFAEKSLEEIESALKSKKNVFIFSLRKGLATITVCKDCGETINCEKCEAPLVLYLSHKGEKRMFVCNRCEEDMSGDTVCASCGSWNLIPLGIGTDTVYEEIKKLLSAQAGFPETKIFKLDKESAKTSKGAKTIIKEFEENPSSILIGTEMAFFYLQNKVSLSVVASFDSLWSIPNFRMGERIIQIILSIANNTKEKFIIQTKNEKDEAVIAIKAENLLSFVREELEDRKKMDYPPFKRFIKITYLGNKEETNQARNYLKKTFEEYSPMIFSGFVARLKDKYMTNTLIKMYPEKWSLPELKINSTIDENLFQKLSSLPHDFEVLVDPEDLL